MKSRKKRKKEEGGRRRSRRGRKRRERQVTFYAVTKARRPSFLNSSNKSLQFVYSLHKDKEKNDKQSIFLTFSVF